MPSAIAYDRSGEGPPLILLHPLGADRHVWDPIVERLRSERDLIAIDLPGFGESPPLERTPTPKALGVAVAEFIDALGLDRPHVVGNSLGGWIALELGLTAAARSVTGISPAGLWPSPLVPKPVIAHKLAQMLLPLVGTVSATRAARQVLLHSAVAHPGRVPRAAAARLIRAYAQASGFKAVNDQMRAGVFGGLERIRVPITLIWPERDRLVPQPRWLPPNVRNLKLPDAGHVPMWDAPQALAEILLESTAEAPAVRDLSSLRRSA
jgi:pimeloyl-ACP methyl ester carboxylesterase